MTSHDDHRPEEEREAGTGPVDEIADPPKVANDGDDPNRGAHSREVTDGSADEPGGGWLGLSGLSVWANTTVVALFMVPSAIVGTIVLVVVGQPWWALLPIPATGAFIALMTYIDMLRLRAIRYRVTAERMEIRSGIIAKAYRSIPRERVRSVDVAAPIYVRVFGLCTVTVGTGEKVGSGGDQLKLEFVTAEQGERLRRELLQRGPSTSTLAGEGEARARVEESELVRMDPRWFAYAPATTATFGIGFGVVATLIGANAQSGGRGWLWISEQAGLPSAQEVSDFVMGRLALIVPLALLGLLLSGVVVLLVVAVETWWDYRLTREGDGTVRLRRGLLTSVSLSVEGRRLNGVVLREPLVLRAVGGASVQAVATGLEGGDEKKTSAKSRLSPAMPRARARELGTALMRGRHSPLDVALARHPRAALRRRFTRAGIVTLLGMVLAGLLGWLHMIATESWWEAARVIEENLVPIPVVVEGVQVTPSWGWALPALFVGVAAFWYAMGSYRGLGHGLHSDYLVLRHGMAVRDTVTLEKSAVIGWRITRSPFQRRLGLADVSATTAAGAGMYTVADVGLGQGLAWADEAVPELLAPFLERVEGEEATKGPSVSL